MERGNNNNNNNNNAKRVKYEKSEPEVIKFYILELLESNAKPDDIMTAFHKFVRKVKDELFTKGKCRVQFAPEGDVVECFSLYQVSIIIDHKVSEMATTIEEEMDKVDADINESPYTETGPTNVTRPVPTDFTKNYLQKLVTHLCILGDVIEDILEKEQVEEEEEKNKKAGIKKEKNDDDDDDDDDDYGGAYDDDEDQDIVNKLQKYAGGGAEGEFEEYE